MRRVVFKVKRRCLKNVGTEFFPGLCFREDCLAQRMGAIPTLLCVTNFEGQLHVHRMVEAIAADTRLTNPSE